MENRQTQARRQAGGARRGMSSYVLLLICIICCVGMLCVATGCRNSDALKEIIYDQNADIIDYDNEDKFYINDPDADETSKEVSSDEAAAVNKVTEKIQNIVVYSSSPNSEEYQAKQSIWSEDPDFTGLEASDTVSFFVSEDEDVKSTVPKEDEEEEDDDEEQEETETEAPVASTTGTMGTTGSGGTGKSEEKGNMTSDTAAEEEALPGEGAGEGADSTEYDDVAQIVDTTNDFVDPPEVDHIAAFGQLAVIVQMIGGEGALVAADNELLTDSGFQKVFSDEGASDITVAWSDDGTAEGLDVDALIESGADTVLVTSSDYSDDLSSEQRTQLNEAGVTFTVVADLTNSTLIKSAVKTVGKMLKSSTEIANAGQTTELASEYVEFHDEIISQCIDANDGLGSYNSNIYELRNTKSYSYNNSAKFTLLIDAWDSSVRWADGSLTMNGIGISNTGYASSPVSFYIQAGGLVNTAAAKAGKKNVGTHAVWQFAQGYRCYKTNFTYDEGGEFDESLTSTSSSDRLSIASTSWGDVFLAAPSDGEVTIQGSSSGIAPSSFGSEEFPKVIAATQEIKEKLIANSEEEDGAYRAYEFWQPHSIGGQYGPTFYDKAWACIGCPGTTAGNAFADNDYVIPDDAVVVNPHGLFSSWTEGGSVEAVLEAVWVNDEVNDDTESIGWKDELKEFYSTFYRYDLTSSDIEAIEEGLEE